MHPGPTRPQPQRARGTPELPVQRAQAPLPPPQPPPPQDETADPAANTGHHTPPWSKVWSVIAASDLDGAARVTAWRLLRGKLFVGAFQRHIHRGTVASHLCPHANCQGRFAMFVSCPSSAPDEGGTAKAGLPPLKPVREHICVLPDVGVHQQPVPPDHGSGIGHDATGNLCGGQRRCGR
jgi:hypothetical protein